MNGDNMKRMKTLLTIFLATSLVAIGGLFALASPNQIHSTGSNITASPVPSQVNDSFDEQCWTNYTKELINTKTIYGNSSEYSGITDSIDENTTLPERWVHRVLSGNVTVEFEYPVSYAGSKLWFVMQNHGETPATIELRTLRNNLTEHLKNPEIIFNIDHASHTWNLQKDTYIITIPGHTAVPVIFEFQIAEPFQSTVLQIGEYELIPSE